MHKNKLVNNFNSVNGVVIRERSPKAPIQSMGDLKRANSNKGKDRYYHRRAVENKQDFKYVEEEACDDEDYNASQNGNAKI